MLRFPAAIVVALALTANSAKADEPIVGLWQVTWKDADTQDVILKLWDVWHADRTETQNDTTPILIGNVCQGTWIPLGHRTYGLTHPAFNFLSAPEDQEGRQGGMTLYYTWRHNHESLGVIDRYGLMDRYLGASPTALLPGKTRYGLRRRYDYLMQNLERIQVECGMPEPDVVYDLVFDERERGALEQRGFVPVFIQGGFVRSTEPRFPGRHLSGRAAVFVQRRYLEALGPEYRWTVAF